MAPKVKLGNTSDNATAVNELVFESPHSSLEVTDGDHSGHSTSYTRIEDRSGTLSPPPPQEKSRTDSVGDKGSTLRDSQVQSKEGGAGELWAKGSFFLVAFLTVGAVIGTLAYRLSWYLVPLSVVGAIIVLYLLAIVLQPNGALTEKGLVSVLTAYIRLAFTVHPDSVKKPKAVKNN
jgi:hypothetical protein